MKKGLASLFVSFHFAVAVAGVKTAPQEEAPLLRVLGPVETVRIEEARFSNRSGHWVEEPRKLSARITYDSRGNKTEVIGNEATGKTTYTYDTQGNRMEEAHYGSDGTFYSKLVYIYDDKGLLTKTISYSRDGSPYCETLYTYDAQDRLTEQTSDCANRIACSYDPQGNLTEEVFYYPDGSSIKLRLVHAYDAQGHRIRTTAYGAHDPGLGIEKTVETYDAYGNIVELTTYYTQRADDPERPVPPPAKFVYTYEFDAHGNWIKQTQTYCSSETGTLVCEPSHLSQVTYRTITYYSEADRPGR